MERITVDLIGSKEFTIEQRGYNRKEVDEFLDDICDEMERMEEEIRSLKQRNAIVVERQAPPVAGPTAEADTREFREILEMARKVKDETIRQAREDAEKIRADAKTDAQKDIETLGSERESLKKAMDDLKKEAESYRAKFEKLLDSQREQMEKFAELFK